DVARWQTFLQPYLALQGVIEPATEEAGAATAVGFALTMLVISVLINAWSILRLRVWNPSGEPVQPRARPADADEGTGRARAHAPPGPVRRVWANPVLWREVATRAYGRRPLLVKAAYFLVVGLICWYALGGGSGEWAAARGLGPVGILSLLLVSAQAATAITSERDSGALDLLLVTDLTPKEFIFGKLLGILWNTKEFLLPPLLLAVVYACRGELASPAPRFLRDLPEDVYRSVAFWKNFEALLAVLVGAAVLFAFTIVLGLHVA